MLATTDLERLLTRIDDLSREHCGMPIDPARLASDTAYREAVFRVLERAAHGDVRRLVESLRQDFSRALAGKPAQG